jgi:ubiquitin carboxyl-terminal hydrolase 1
LVTHQKLLQEADRLTALTAADPNASSSRKKRARDARKLEARIKVALEEGRLEDDIPGIKMEKIYSAESTKQAMIARVRIY